LVEVGIPAAIFPSAPGEILGPATEFWSGVFGGAGEGDLDRGSAGAGAVDGPHEAGRQAAIQVEALLVPGLGDWVVAVADAQAALDIYAGLEGEALKAAVAFAGKATMACLLDNLPAGGRETVGFANLSQHLKIDALTVPGLGSPDEALDTPDAGSLTSSSVTPSSVTPSSVAASSVAPSSVAPSSAVSVPAAAELKELLALDDRTRLLQIMAGLPAPMAMSDVQQKFLADVFFSGQEETLTMRAFEARFAVSLDTTTRPEGGNERYEDWEKSPDALERMWHILAALPPAHVEGDPESVMSLIKVENSDRDWLRNRGTAGFYTAGHDTIGMYVGDDREEKEESGDQSPLTGVNRFDKVVRHEIGHAVDAQLGFMQKKGSADCYGGWQVHSIEQVLQAGADKFGLPQDFSGVPVQGQLEAGMAAASATRRWTSFEEKLVDKELLSDALVVALSDAFWIKKNPWSDGRLGFKVGDRTYVLGYRNAWASYKSATHSAKVSNYQFRAPAEWFAEAYAAYFDPSGGEQGALLAQTNPAAKKAFDRDIATVTPRGSGDPSLGSD
jgi:hypothetical protein